MLQLVLVLAPFFAPFAGNSPTSTEVGTSGTRSGSVSGSGAASWLLSIETSAMSLMSGKDGEVGGVTVEEGEAGGVTEVDGEVGITAEKTITGGIPKSWCDYSPEVTCGLHPHNLRFQSLIGLTPERKVDYFFCI